MTVQTFGVTADKVRLHYFPHINGWSTNTSPSLATVGELIDEKAADLQGQLLLVSVAASALGALAATEAPYLWCRNTLRLSVAVALVPRMTGADPDVAKRWEKELDARFARLRENAGAELGDNSIVSAASNPEGPTSHISELSLDVGDTSLASDVVPRFRRSDKL